MTLNMIQKIVLQKSLSYKDMNFSYDFTGKVVLITGSSCGMGARIAITYARCGAQVVVTGSSADSVSQVAKRCSDVSPNDMKPLEVVVDIGDKHECHRLVQTVVDVFGKLNIVVNNAEMVWNHSIMDSEYIDSYRQLMERNLNSIVYLTHFSVYYLKQTKGNIVNNTSVEGIQESSGFSPNCMSKSGVNLFTRFVSKELQSQGIRINSVNPGGVRTNVNIYSHSQNESIFDSLTNNYPFWRSPAGGVGQLDDICGAVLYLSSDQAAFVNGFNFVADCCCNKCFSLEIQGFYSIK